MAGRVVKRDTVPCDVDEEGAAPCQLVVHVVERVNDEVHWRFQMLGDRQLTDEAFRGTLPVLARLRGEMRIDDDEQIVVGPVAALAVFHPCRRAHRSRTG